jgi:hypothetical protein
MPEGLDESLTRSEFVDLLAFLQAQKTREVVHVHNVPAGSEAPLVNR